MYETLSPKEPQRSTPNVPQNRSVAEALSNASPRSLDRILREIDTALNTLSDQLHVLRAHQEIDPVNPEIQTDITKKTARIAELMDLQAKAQRSMAAHDVSIQLNDDEIADALRNLELN